MSTDSSLRSIASELKKIRRALERISPPPPRETSARSARPGRTRSAYEDRGVDFI